MIATIQPPQGKRTHLAGKRDYLSWSAISAYRTCPLKYYFRYVLGLPDDRVSASLVFGAAIHRSIEHHFRERMCGGLAPTLVELFEHYQEEWNERDAGKVRFVARIWRAIEAEHFYPAPSPMACGGCPFREPCRKWPGSIC